jgi:hypothetical protein
MTNQFVTVSNNNALSTTVKVKIIEERLLDSGNITPMVLAFSPLTRISSKKHTMITRTLLAT